MTTIDTLSATVTIDAPKSVVWSILDDFTNIQDWTSQVKTSVQLGDTAQGLGAGRQCELAPFGKTDERIIEYVPEDTMVIELTNIKGLPLKRSVTRFSLEAIDDNTTKVTMSPKPEVKGGAGPQNTFGSNRIGKGDTGGHSLPGKPGGAAQRCFPDAAQKNCLGQLELPHTKR